MKYTPETKIDIKLNELFNIDDAFENYGEEYAREQGYFDNEVDDDMIKERIVQLIEDDYDIDTIKNFLEDYDSSSRNELDGYANLRPLEDPTISDFDEDSFLGYVGENYDLDDYILTIGNFIELAQNKNITPYDLFSNIIELAKNGEFYCLKTLGIDKLYDRELLNEEVFNAVLKDFSDNDDSYSFDRLFYELDEKLDELECDPQTVEESNKQTNRQR